MPFLDLRVHHDSLMPELLEAFRQVTESSAFAGGPFVTKFEKEFATYCQSRYAVGVGSGTDALWLSLLALGVGPGDEVITVPNTFIGTAEAISLCGARPVFVDIDPYSYTMDPRLLEAAITLRTQAIVAVHMFGQMADMDQILSIARVHGTPVIEEAGQAPGAEYKGRRAGSLGTAATFSFFPERNLGAIGEAGAVVTEEAELKSKIQMLRDHGRIDRHLHSAIGWNARMDGLQAAVLSVKLQRLTAANEARRAHARLYDTLLESEPRVTRPLVAADRLHVYHIYAVRVKNRDRVWRRMNDCGVNCHIHYPVPIHLQEACASLGLPPGSFPVTEQFARECLSLPMYPELRSDQIEFVVETLKRSLED